MLRFADVDHEEVGAALNNVVDGLNRHARRLVSLANAAGQTYNAISISDPLGRNNQFINCFLVRSGGAAVTDTTPTAAQIVAAMPGCSVGTAFEFTAINNNSATLTIAGGTGVTLSGTMTVAAANARDFVARIDNATAGSEAVTLQSVGTKGV